MTDTVWLLWFEEEREGSEDIELLIGVYASESDAYAAIDRVKDQPGFRDFPSGFKAYERKVGFDLWTKGFTRY